MDENQLMKLLKPQLTDFARKRGIHVASKNTKANIVRKIIGGSAPPAPRPAQAPAPRPAQAPAPRPAQAPAPRPAPVPKSKKIIHKSINNLYNMNVNNIVNQLSREGWVVPKMNKNQLIRTILKSGNTATIHGGGKISNKLINAPPAKGACRSGRLQITGTCWFQGLLNPFLLSDVGRDILQTKLHEFKQSNNMKKWTNINACPLKLNGAFFWSYIEYKLKEDYTNINNYKKVMKGELFENERLIRNLKLKNQNQTIDGGNIFDTIKFLNQVFKNDHGIHTVTPGFRFNYNATMGGALNVNSSYVLVNKDEKNTLIIKPRSYSPLILVVNVLQTGDKFKPVKTIKVDQSEYKLFGAKIASMSGSGGHAMTGYLCSDGNYMFYDSNNIRSMNKDWTTAKFWSTELPEYVKKYFSGETKSNGVFYYARVGPKKTKVSVPPSINILKKLPTTANKPLNKMANKPLNKMANKPLNKMANKPLNKMAKTKIKSWFNKIFK